MISKDALIKGSLPEKEVELPGKGTVRVRGLTRAEVIRIGVLGREGKFDEAEVVILAAGLVEPSLTEDEVRQWRDSVPSTDVDPVADAIQALSGLGEGAEKKMLNEAVQTFRSES